MSKRKKEKAKEPLTPERVIRARIHRLVDRSEIVSFFIKLTWMTVSHGFAWSVLRNYSHEKQ